MADRPAIDSALAEWYRPGSRMSAEPALRLTEIVGWDLLQIATWCGCGRTMHERLARTVGLAPPDAPNRRAAAEGIEFLTVAPDRIWCLGPHDDDRLSCLTEVIDAATGCTTWLGHTHTRVRIEGERVRELLAQEIAIDLAASEFPAESLARTPFHHVPVLLLCLDANRPVFDLFLPRSFAASCWIHLLDLAAALPHAVYPRALPDGTPAEGNGSTDERLPT